jgi:hypothetical protein
MAAGGAAGVVLGSAVRKLGTAESRERRNWGAVVGSYENNRYAASIDHALGGIHFAIEVEGLDSPGVLARLHMICQLSAGLSEVEQRRYQPFCDGAALLEGDPRIGMIGYPYYADRPDCAVEAALRRCRTGLDCRLRAIDSMLVSRMDSAEVQVPRKVQDAKYMHAAWTTGARYCQMLLDNPRLPLRRDRLVLALEGISKEHYAAWNLPRMDAHLDECVECIIAVAVDPNWSASDLNLLKRHFKSFANNWLDIYPCSAQKAFNLGEKILERRVAGSDWNYASMLAVEHIPLSGGWVGRRVVERLKL